MSFLAGNACLKATSLRSVARGQLLFHVQSAIHPRKAYRFSACTPHPSALRLIHSPHQGTAFGLHTYPVGGAELSARCARRSESMILQQGADVPGSPHITLRSNLSLAEERQYCAAAAQTKREPISRLPVLCADRTFAKKHPFSVPFVSSPRRGTRHRHRCSQCTYR